MAERMLVTEALDERDLLVKKINDKIRKAQFVDTIKPNEEKVFEARVSKEEFSKNAESAYQQILDLIDRYQRIDAALVESNAKTQITTSEGTYSVASAISLKNRLKCGGEYDFEMMLGSKLRRSLDEKVSFAEDKNRALNLAAEEMRLSILGNESKAKNDKPLDVVDSYIKENTTEIVDPLGILSKVDSLSERREALLCQLETKIKVSNATTLIEF